MKFTIASDAFKRLITCSLVYPGSGKGFLPEVTAHVSSDGLDVSDMYLGTVALKLCFKPSYFISFDPGDTKELVLSALLFEEIKNKFVNDKELIVNTEEEYLVIEGSREIFRMPLQRASSFDSSLPFVKSDYGAGLIGYLPAGMVPKVQALIMPSVLNIGGEAVRFFCMPESIKLLSTTIGTYEKVLVAQSDITPEMKLALLDISFNSVYLEALTKMFVGAAWLSIDESALALSICSADFSMSYVLARLLD